MNLRALLHPAKDLVAAGAVRIWFNQTQQKYGTMTRIEIDSGRKRVDVELDLAGEPQPIRVSLIDYQLLPDGDSLRMSVGRVETSREWINVLLDEHFNASGKTFKVPAALRILL